MSGPQHGAMKTWMKSLVAVVVLVVALAAGGIWWYLRDDAPAAVSLSAAVESVSDTTAPADAAASADADTEAADTATVGAESSDSGTSTESTVSNVSSGTPDDAGAPTSGSVSGTWAVDTTTGEFDYESATGTFAGFRIEEELASIGSTTAVGRTGDVAGSITIEGTTLTAATFEVDMTTITTNDSRRDDQVAQALDVSTYPTGTFTLTEPVDLGAAAATGEPIAVTVVGELTIHGVTHTVELPIEAQLVDGTIVLVGSIDIVFSDYDVAVPASRVVVSVEDHGTLEFQILLTAS
jgi:polyisoprenoid-binding protein YceI